MTTGYRSQATKDGIASSYTYNGNLLTQAGDVSFTHNSDGSRATKTSGSDPWNYNYDSLGRLSQVSLKGNQIGSYGYGADGWRIWKEENGKTTIYVRNDDRVIYQEIFNGTNVNNSSTPESKRALVYLGDELVGTVNSGTEVRYYVNDHLGTTEYVTDAGGNTLSRIEHTPFGDIVQVQSGTTTGDSSEDYFFTGKEKDATGLYYRFNPLKLEICLTIS